MSLSCIKCGSSATASYYVDVDKDYHELKIPHMNFETKECWNQIHLTHCFDCEHTEVSIDRIKEIYEILEKIEEDPSEENVEHLRDEYGYEFIEKYAKKFEKPKQFVFDIEEKNNIGFAYLYEKGTTFDQQLVDYDYWKSRYLTQLKPGLFAYKYRGKFGTKDDLREELKKKGFEENV